MVKRGVTSGYHDETQNVGRLTSAVEGIHTEIKQESHLNTTQAQRVSQIYQDLTQVILQYARLAQADVKEFDNLGVKIEVEDQEDAKR